MKDFGGKQLTNGKTTNSKPTLSTVNLENTGSNFQNAVKTAVDDRFKTDAKFLFDSTLKAGEMIKAPAEEKLKNQ